MPNTWRLWRRVAWCISGCDIAFFLVTGTVLVQPMRFWHSCCSDLDRPYGVEIILTFTDVNFCSSVPNFKPSSGRDLSVSDVPPQSMLSSSRVVLTKYCPNSSRNHPDKPVESSILILPFHPCSRTIPEPPRRPALLPVCLSRNTGFPMPFVPFLKHDQMPHFVVEVSFMLLCRASTGSLHTHSKRGCGMNQRATLVQILLTEKDVFGINGVLAEHYYEVP